MQSLLHWLNCNHINNGEVHMDSVAYRCIKCDGRVTVERLFHPVGQPPFVRCPFCGLACAPEQVIERATNKSGGRDWGMLFAWSRCPHAHECEGWEKYDHQCEEGQIMPKCLHALHQLAGVAEHRYRELASPGYAPRPKKSRRGKSGPETGS